MNKIKLLVDCRKHADYGIGEYITNLFLKKNNVASALSNIDLTYLFNHGTVLPDGFIFDEDNCLFIKTKPFSILEQFQLFLLIRKYDLFWATSLSHPLLLSRKKIIAMVHDVAQLDLPARSLRERIMKLFFYLYLRSIASKSIIVYFNSRFTKNRFLSYFKDTTASNFVTELGSRFDHRSLSDCLVNATTKKFLILGNARPHKNLSFAISGFLALKELSDFELHVIGSSSYSEEIHKFAKSNNRIHVHGFLDDKLLVQLFRNSVALIFPSLYEGFGLPALEAMSQGCPVIASENSSLPEVCSDVAFYFDPEDTNSYKKALLDFLYQNSLNRKYIVESSIARANFFSWSFCIEKTVQGLKELAES